MASLLLPTQFTCSLSPHQGIRGQIHKTKKLRRNILKHTGRMLNLNVGYVSRNHQDAVEGSSDEDSDGESSTKEKRTPRRGRRKTTTETLEVGAEENQITSENESLEEKIVKRRGRKKATATASSEEEKDQAKEPEKSRRRKVKTVEESSEKGEDQIKVVTPSYQKEDDTVKQRRKVKTAEESSEKGEDQNKDLAPSYQKEDDTKKLESALLEDIGVVDNVNPLVCCFGPAKYFFIPSGRPANRLINLEMHDFYKFWSPDKFVRAPGGPSSNVALALAAMGGRVAFMGKLGDDEYGQSLLYRLNKNGVQTREVSIDSSAPTAVSFMKITSRGGLKTKCVKPCAEDCFVPSDIKLSVLKEAKMFYYNSSALLEPSTQSSLFKAIDFSKKFGGVTFFDLNLALPLWSSSKETKSLIKEAWEAANIIEVTKQELEFLCDIKPSEKFDSKDNHKSKFNHYSSDIIMKLWHDNLKVLFVTNGTSKINFYTEKDNGWVRGTEDAPITPFTGDMSQSGDAIVAALMKMLVVNLHLVTDKVYLHEAVKLATTCGVIDQWKLAREWGFPKESEDANPTSERDEERRWRSITEGEYGTRPDAVQSENSSTDELLYVE